MDWRTVFATNTALMDDIETAFTYIYKVALAHVDIETNDSKLLLKLAELIAYEHFFHGRQITNRELSNEIVIILYEFFHRFSWIYMWFGAPERFV